MKIELNNDNGYNVNIDLNDMDKKKEGEDVLYDIFALMATFVGTVQYAIYQLQRYKESLKYANVVKKTGRKISGLNIGGMSIN